MRKLRELGIASVHLFVALLLIGLTAEHGLSQTTLFEQTVISPIGNPATGPISFASTVSTSDDTIPNRSYDNFVLTDASELTQLNWVGTYNGLFNPVGLRSVVDFEVKIYSNTAGNEPMSIVYCIVRRKTQQSSRAKCATNNAHVTRNAPR